MKLLRKRDIPEERYTNAFLGYGPEEAHFVIELTYSTLHLQYMISYCKANIYPPSNYLNKLSQFLFWLSSDHRLWS